MGEVSRFGGELGSVSSFFQEGAVVPDASPDHFCGGHVRVRFFSLRSVHAFPPVRFSSASASMFSFFFSRRLFRRRAGWYVPVPFRFRPPFSPRFPTSFLSILLPRPFSSTLVRSESARILRRTCCRGSSRFSQVHVQVSLSPLTLLSSSKRGRGRGRKGGMGGGRRDGGRRPSCAPPFSLHHPPPHGFRMGGGIRRGGDPPPLVLFPLFRSSRPRIGRETGTDPFPSLLLVLLRSGLPPSTHPFRMGKGNPPSLSLPFDCTSLRPRGRPPRRSAMADTNPFALLDEDGGNAKEEIRNQHVPGEGDDRNANANAKRVEREKDAGGRRTERQPGRKRIDDDEDEGRREKKKNRERDGQD